MNGITSTGEKHLFPTSSAKTGGGVGGGASANLQAVIHLAKPEPSLLSRHLSGQPQKSLLAHEATYLLPANWRHQTDPG